MSSPVTASASNKSAYQRPYKSRGQRREADRRKTDEARDYKFLIRAASVVGFLLVVALAFAVTGFVDRQDALPRTGASR
ncbi:hypothetical protein [Hymenobacter sp.]|uniref:hypothetical protein n=1 Tax=Hymenobacter sp. TaxID=1898978 RepID=UPI00286BB8E0|nr:hypothetical protein [Hymenobacter sp.]